VVTAFKFEGNTLFSDIELSEALSTLVGNPIDFHELQASVVVVSDLYRNKGWVVQARLPAQDISNGEVTIHITEAVVGRVQTVGAQAKRIKPEHVFSIFEQHQRPGDFLNIKAVDRALMLANELPGVTVTGTLAPGQQSGQTDLLLMLVDGPLISGSAAIDNSGAVPTGSDRVNLALTINSPLGYGDSFSASAISSQGSNYARIAYNAPLGIDGWRLGVNTSQLDYALISDTYLGLNASGISSTAGFDLNYPAVRSRSFNLTTSLTFEKKDYFNVSGGATSSAYSNTLVSLGLSSNSFDALGAGANSYAWLMTWGQLNLDGSPTQMSDASTSQTAGDYSKIRYTLSRHQQLDANVLLYASLSGQWANKNLDSSEKFYLGGVSGVRAYPSGEGGGSQGQLLNVELRWRLPGNLNLVGFYDVGRVMVNANNDFSGSPTLNEYALRGAGLELNWRSASGVALQAIYARRVGENPNAIATDLNRGADQDGTFYRDRLWLTATLTY
jgi:hypothetical protein